MILCQPSIHAIRVRSEAYTRGRKDTSTVCVDVRIREVPPLTKLEEADGVVQEGRGLKTLMCEEM